MENKKKEIIIKALKQGKISTLQALILFEMGINSDEVSLFKPLEMKRFKQFYKKTIRYKVDRIQLDCTRKRELLTALYEGNVEAPDLKEKALNSITFDIDDLSEKERDEYFQLLIKITPKKKRV